MTSERAPRSKNGNAPHNTTGVASINSIQMMRRVPSACCTGIPGIISDIDSANSGSASAELSQKRRDMSASSGLGASAASASNAAVRGSSAIPHFGQFPG